VLLKNGFSVEGVRKNAVIKNGVLMDDVMMGRLRLHSPELADVQKT